MKKIFITIAAVAALTSCKWEQQQPTALPQQALWKAVRKDTTTVQQSIPDTATSLLTPLWPVPIVRVTRARMDGYKWEVESENGIVFYTNHKPEVGDVAFYMDGDSEKVYWTKH